MTTQNTEWNGCFPAITAQEITETEADLGLKMTRDFRIHYLQHNGGVPPVNRWDNRDGKHFEVDNFLPIRYGVPDEEGGEGSGFGANGNVLNYGLLEQTYLQLVLTEVIPSHLLPFAFGRAGKSVYCVDCESNEVFHFAMEKWNSKLEAAVNHSRMSTLLTGNFCDFVSLLK